MAHVDPISGEGREEYRCHNHLGMPPCGLQPRTALSLSRWRLPAQSVTVPTARSEFAICQVEYILFSPADSPRLSGLRPFKLGSDDDDITSQFEYVTRLCNLRPYDAYGQTDTSPNLSWKRHFDHPLIGTHCENNSITAAG